MAFARNGGWRKKSITISHTSGFSGLNLTEKAPEATTLSVNRKRRFRDNHIPEQIFKEILRQAVEKGLVGGVMVYTDSTHVKAKANNHKKQNITVERTPKAYLEE